MDDAMPRFRNGLLLSILAGLAGCGHSTPISELGPVRPTLDAIGKRLSNTLSERKLSALAADGPAVLAALNGRERDVLARGLLRFYSEVPVVVDVAAPENSVPFWVEDLGFASTDTVLTNPDARWKVFRRRYPPGWIGLGVNGLDRRPEAHYVVFLHGAPGSPPLREDSIRLEGSTPGNWSVVRAAPGVSAAKDVHRPFDALPPALDGSLLLQPSHDQRHATVLATGRVWKTHVASDQLPDQVTIAFGADPARELSWNWRTAPEVTGTRVRLVSARYEAVEHDARGRRDLRKLRLIEGSSQLVRSEGLLNDPVNRRHVAVASGLEPDTTYLYSLGDGTKAGWGPWRAIKTGRLRGRIEFLFMGDVQTGMEEWGKRMMNAFRRHPGIEFVLLGGDLVDRGNERTNWDHFFLRASEVFERLPVMPCAGNHEYLDRGPRLFRSFFTLPDNGPEGIDPGLVYSFEYGNAFFAILDSTLAVSDPRLARRQADWLDQALSQTRCSWKLVMFHHPVYPSHAWRDTPHLAEHWVPVFDKHHVDLVLQGHDHAYLRTYPMRGNRPAGGSGDGTIYLVAVAGDKFCEQRRSDYMEVAFTNVSTYQTIEIDDIVDRLTYRAWNDAGKVVDQFVINKPGPRRPELVRSKSALLR